MACPDCLEAMLLDSRDGRWYCLNEDCPSCYHGFIPHKVRIRPELLWDCVDHKVTARDGWRAQCECGWVQMANERFVLVDAVAEHVNAV